MGDRRQAGGGELEVPVPDAGQSGAAGSDRDTRVESANVRGRGDAPFAASQCGTDAGPRLKKFAVVF